MFWLYDATNGFADGFADCHGTALWGTHGIANYVAYVGIAHYVTFVRPR